MGNCASLSQPVSDFFVEPPKSAGGNSSRPTTAGTNANAGSPSLKGQNTLDGNGRNTSSAGQRERPQRRPRSQAYSAARPTTSTLELPTGPDGKLLMPSQLREAERTLKDIIGKSEEECDLSHPPGGKVREEFPRLVKFPPGILKVEILQELRLRNNSIRTLPVEVGDLQELRFIDIGGNRVTELPETLFKLPKLTVLDASGNQLRSLPATIGDAAVLQRLFLYKNQLTMLPPEMSTCEALEELSVFDNVIFSLPSWISCLSKLRILNISGNRLKTLPDLEQWPPLTRLDVRWNYIVKLPKLTQLSGLLDLQLEGNLLSTSPVLGTMLQLELMNVSYNSIISLNDSITSAAGLRVLRAGSNRLTLLPSEIRNWRELEVLDLSHNQIREVPEEIGDCLRLQVLDLSDNRLFTLPPSLVELEKLKTLRIGSNPFRVTEELKETTMALLSVCSNNKGRVEGAANTGIPFRFVSDNYEDSSTVRQGTSGPFTMRSGAK